MPFHPVHLCCNRYDRHGRRRPAAQARTTSTWALTLERGGTLDSDKLEVSDVAVAVAVAVGCCCWLLLLVVGWLFVCLFVCWLVGWLFVCSFVCLCVCLFVVFLWKPKRTLRVRRRTAATTSATVAETGNAGHVRYCADHAVRPFLNRAWGHRAKTFSSPTTSVTVDAGHLYYFHFFQV